MPPLLRVSLPLALMFAVAPLRAAEPPADKNLEGLVTAMARVGDATGPQYSPDGKTIAFHTNISGVSQVWLIPADGGYPRAVTAGPDAANGARWLPDGRLAYAVAPSGGYDAALLVMHGANDTNVPVVETEQIVETLKERDVTVEYVLFPDEGHGWRKEANRVRSTLELTHFFDRNLLP